MSQLGDARRVVLADDSVLLREGVARLLEEAGFEVVGQSGNGEDLLRHVAMHKPDVAVIDIRMPPTHTDEGLRAAQEIRDSIPGSGVLLLSQYVEPGYAMALLESSAGGRRVSAEGSRRRPRAVRHGRPTSRGRRFCPRPRGRERAGRAGSRETTRSTELTAREREVLQLMAEGRSNQAIAERLFVTLRAVEKHVTSIFTKLGLPASTDDHRRVLAVLAYLRA